MLYDVMYYGEDGTRLASFDPAVTAAYVARLGVPFSEKQIYAIAKNINGDGHTICIAPDGREVSYESLPWVIAEREAQKVREQERIEIETKHGKRLLSQRNAHISKVRDGEALVSVDNKPSQWISIEEIRSASTQQDPTLRQFYLALLERVNQYSTSR